MVGIPSTIDTDAEDVAWALQTADALWKRNERGDALVWLRRAAQAAGEAQDDDRALTLARQAAELSDWVSRNPLAVSRMTPPPLPSQAARFSKRPRREGSEAPLPRAPSDSTSTEISVEFALEESPSPAPTEAPALRAMRPPPLPAVAPPPLPVLAAELPARDEPALEPSLRVRSAAEIHAGMLDPWADDTAPTRPIKPSPRPLVSPPPVRRTNTSSSSNPPVERTVAAPPLMPNLVVSPPVPEAAPMEPGGLDDLDDVHEYSSRATPLPAPSIRTPAPPAGSTPPSGGVDLSQVESLSDLPDDAREEFARAAAVHQLRRDEEVSGFALAVVLDGTVHLAATIVDTPARRLEAGTVMRARGTIEYAAPVRLVGVSDRASVATWDEQAVAEAFRSCPWVETELRSAGDRLQAEVGLAMGPLGERLDLSLRADVTGKMKLRALAENEELATRGKPVPGLVVVGAGELEALTEDGAPSGEVLRAGQFLFPSSVLSAAPAPSTVRACGGGALVLIAERGVAQELLVTCPPLLEILASG